MNASNTILLRCLATVLITNSHLDFFYPDSRLGTGGALGNALFFMLSGYGLSISLTGKSAQQSFTTYFRKRIKRLYPSLFLVTGIVFLFSNGLQTVSAHKLVSLFVWPTQYGFISAIIILYIPFFWIAKLQKPQLLLCIFLMCIPYFYLYFYFFEPNHFFVEEGRIKWIIYFQLMIFGAWIAKTPNHEHHLTVKVIMLSLVTLSFYGVKILVFPLGLGVLQFINQLLLFPFVYWSHSLATDREILSLATSRHFNGLITLLGGLTLEIYVVQVPLIHFLKTLSWSTNYSLLVLCFSLIPISFITAQLGRLLPASPLFTKGDHYENTP